MGYGRRLQTCKSNPSIGFIACKRKSSAFDVALNLDARSLKPRLAGNAQIAVAGRLNKPPPDMQLPKARPGGPVRYDLEVLRDDEIVAAERFVLADSRDLWSRIARMAKHVDEPGCQIRVTEEAGGIAILIGVAAARRSFTPPAPRLRTLTAVDAPSGHAPAIV